MGAMGYGLLTEAGEVMPGFDIELFEGCLLDVSSFSARHLPICASTAGSFIRFWHTGHATRPSSIVAC